MQIFANFQWDRKVMGPLSGHIMLLFKIINTHIHLRGMVQDNQSRQLKKHKMNRKFLKHCYAAMKEQK